MNVWRTIALLLLIETMTGCRSQTLFWKHKFANRLSISRANRGSTSEKAPLPDRQLAEIFDSDTDDAQILTVSAKTSEPIDENAAPDKPGPELPSPDHVEPPKTATTLELDQVIQSIYASYPLLQIAFYGRNIAAGDQLSAEGAWDLKLKADANNAPIGYYRTYRNGTGFEQPLMTSWVTAKVTQLIGYLYVWWSRWKV